MMLVESKNIISCDLMFCHDTHLLGSEQRDQKENDRSKKA